MHHDLSNADWKTSRRSQGNGECVEVALVPGNTGVRDSKDRSGPVLDVTSADWHHFTTAAKAGRFDR